MCKTRKYSPVENRPSPLGDPKIQVLANSIINLKFLRMTNTKSSQGVRKIAPIQKKSIKENLPTLPLSYNAFFH